jgi:hypothetical protein
MSIGKPASQSILTFWICSQHSVNILPQKMLHSSAKSFHTNTLYIFRVGGHQISMLCVIVFKTFRLQVSGFVAFSKVSTPGGVFKSWRLQCAFSSVRVDGKRICNKMFADTKNPETCGRDLRIELKHVGIRNL